MFASVYIASFPVKNEIITNAQYVKEIMGKKGILVKR